MAGRQTSAQWREMDETLKRLWADGCSAAEIAARLGSGITMNGVIGRIHRLGMSGRRKVRKAAPKQPKHPVSTPPVAPRAVPPRADVEPIGAALAPLRECEPVNDGDVALMSLRAGQCKFPSGDLRKGDLTFCGAIADAGCPYCAAHRAICYTAPQKFVPRAESAPRISQGAK